MKYYTSRFLLIIFTTFVFHFNALGLLPPEIIPHRGGKGERPENTIPSFQDCIALGAKILELDVQVTKDGLAVVYHPADLAANTNGKGKIKDHDYADLKNLDAAYNFEKNGDHTERGKGHRIPLFEDVLTKFPKVTFVVDLKSLPAEKLIDAVAKVANKHNAWDRLVFYSTDDSHLQYLKKTCPHAKAFESRRSTVEELLNINGSPTLLKSNDPLWLGFELNRQMIVSEKLALGDAEYPVNLVVWTEQGMKRIREKLPKARFVLFGINCREDYHKAESLGVYAVYTDYPTLLSNIGKT